MKNDNKKDNNKKGFFRRLVSLIMALVAIAGVVMAAMSWLCCLVSPVNAPVLQFFGIAFWPILAFNVVVLVLLALVRSKKAFLSLVALLVSLPGFLKSYSFGKTSEEDGIKVMSYNVHIFQDIANKRNAELFVHDIVDMVRSESPDVLCLQEFSSYISQKSRVYCMKKFAAEVGFEHIYYNEENDNLGRNVIFSNYPLKPLSTSLSSRSNDVNGIMVEVDAGEKGKFAIADVHLLSFKITDKELEELLADNSDSEVTKKRGMSLFNKMSYAFEHRAFDVNDMLAAMPKDDTPVIVCGDFNDTPVSYVCQKMTHAGFYDAFIKSGHGIGATHLGKLPWLRIDYLWINKYIKSLDYKKIDFKGSDHYPIMMKFQLNGKEAVQ